MKKIWFIRKRYGWGWQPSSWQGWSVTLLYIIITLVIFRSVDSASHSISDTLIGFAPIFIAFTLLFSLICYLTGETPSWQWGEKK